MKRLTRERIAPLLEVLRENAALREVRPTVFHLEGREFLHFHDEPDGAVADVRLTRSFVRMPVSSSSEHAELLERIDEFLDAFDSRARDRQRRGRERRRR
jgi:hypothetical protein